MTCVAAPVVMTVDDTDLGSATVAPIQAFPRANWDTVRPVA